MNADEFLSFLQESEVYGVIGSKVESFADKVEMILEGGAAAKEVTFEAFDTAKAELLINDEEMEDICFCLYAIWDPEFTRYLVEWYQSKPYANRELEFVEVPQVAYETFLAKHEKNTTTAEVPTPTPEVEETTDPVAEVEVPAPTQEVEETAAPVAEVEVPAPTQDEEVGNVTEMPVPPTPDME